MHIVYLLVTLNFWKIGKTSCSLEFGRKQEGQSGLRALASHQYELDLIPRLSFICILLLLILTLALWVLQFFSILKKQHSKFQFNLEFEGYIVLTVVWLSQVTLKVDLIFLKAKTCLDSMYALQIHVQITLQIHVHVVKP